MVAIPIVGGYITDPATGSTVRCNSAIDPVPPGGIVTDHFPTDAELASWGITATLQQQAIRDARTLAKALLDSPDVQTRVTVSLMLAILDQLNLQGGTINSIMAAITAPGATLATIKAAIAAIPTITQHSAAEVLTMMKAKIDAGN